MKVVGLLSGGKDSCFNLVHCAAQGHRIVAAASLGPGSGKEEIDSYLYQTVGQDAIELVAGALEIPLYRRAISGTAVEQRLEYGSRQHLVGVVGDEAEDLFQLLTTVKENHLDVLGVSVGAILSNYQRVRVEHVCRRLGLIPLCYLWQRNQEELLSEMIDAGVESVLIKVAGIGLTARHLGKSLAQMRPTLLKLNSLYGSHVCGEGGEYETFTLDCSLFKKRIRIDDSEIVYLDDNEVAPVAFLRIKKASLVDKLTSSAYLPSQLRIPPLLTDTGQHVYDHLSLQEMPVLLRPSSAARGPWITVANVQASIEPGANLSLGDEVRQCFEVIAAQLSQHALELRHITLVNMLLTSMDIFADVNTVYASYFGTSPPARACVAVDLPAPHRVRLDCLAFKEQADTAHRTRGALHVQSMSYWAPANIGPYSQAISVDQRLFISGQIGLVPSTLKLPAQSSLAKECALSLQHVDTVVAALREGDSSAEVAQWNETMQMAIVWVSRQSDLLIVQKAWDARERFVSQRKSPVLFVVVKELPKGALVETQVIIHTGRIVTPAEDDDESVLRTQMTTSLEDSLPFEAGTVHWEMSTVEGGGPTCVLLCVRGDVDPQTLNERLESEPMIRAILGTAMSARLFYTHSLPSATTMATELLRDLPVSTVSSRHLSTRNLKTWDFAISVLGQ